MTTQALELTVQVLVEMEDGGEVPVRTREYVEDKILNFLPPTAHGIRAVVTIADEEDNVVVAKNHYAPTEELRKRAWTAYDH